MLISGKFKVKKDFVCSVCGKKKLGEQFILEGVSEGVVEMIDKLNNAIKEERLSFPVGWANSASGIYCEECK